MKRNETYYYSTSPKYCRDSAGKALNSIRGAMIITIIIVLRDLRIFQRQDWQKCEEKQQKREFFCCLRKERTGQAT